MSSRLPANKGIKKWIIARTLASGDLYQDRIYGVEKASLFADLRGTVVEIGAGTGVNLPYLPKEVSWIGIEPNPHMHRFIYQKAAHLGVEVQVVAGYAEALSFPDDSVDAVISTLVLCSVPDQQAVLREIRRVLKPGGRFIFIEHVAARSGSTLRRIQRIIRPVWRWIADDCRPDRETRQAIERAGFSETNIVPFKPKVPLTIRVIRPHIRGVAVK